MFDGDLNLPRIPFDEKAYATKKFKIGYFGSDGWFEPCVTSHRALNETIQGLTDRGHSCVKINPPTDGWYSNGLLVAINTAEGYMRSYVEALEGEELLPEYYPLLRAASLPEAVRQVLVRCLDVRRSHLLAQGRGGGLSVFHLWKKAALVLKLRDLWSEAVAGFDAVIYPAMPLPALPHGISGDLTCCCSYMFLANMLDWPAGVVPVTVVQPDETHYRNSKYEDVYTRLVREKVMPGSAGLPIAVSVMAPAFQEEMCLAVMKEVEEVANFQAKPPAAEHADGQE
jgi:fatty acid amide hydrolase